MVPGHDFNTSMEYYKVFYYVAKLKSITLAADRLSLTQPSISKTIQRLEEDLQCRLFVRTKHGVTLTTEGEAIWSRVESACELIIAAERELEAIQTLDSGTMNIASVEMGFTTYILPALQLFLQEHPQIKVKFRTKTPEQILDMLKSGLIDVALLISPIELDETFEYHVIDAFHESLIVGPKYAFLAEDEHTLQELSKYPFISVPEGFSGYEYMKECFRDNGLIYEPDMEVTSLEFVIQAAAANFGIGTIPLQTVEKRIENGSLFRLKLKKRLPERSVLVITNRMTALNKPTQVFIEDFLKKPVENRQSIT